MTDWRGRRFQFAVLTAAVLAVAMRTLPMYRSPLPFNPDGIVHASKAAEAVADGRLPLARMATDDLHFEALLAVAAVVTGATPTELGQPLVALVGVGPVLVGAAVARRLCRSRGWSAARARPAAVLAGLLLAVEGLYLHRSMATDEQTVGLFLVPLTAVAVHRGYRTDRRAWWVGALALLVAIPPLHNLDAMITALALTALVALSAVRGSLGRPFARLVGLAVGFWVAFAGYHLAVERYTPAAIIQQTRILDAPGLLLAWLVAAALVGAWYAGRGPRFQRAVGGGVFGTLFALLALNAVTTVFPETRATPTAFLLLLVPLALPVGLAVWRAPDVARVGDGPALLAVGAGVFALVGVSLTAALTPEYLETGLRATTFLHLPVLVAAGVGTAAALTGGGGGALRSRSAVRVAVAGLVVVSAVASVPVAFGGLSMLTYKGVTTPAEFAATEFAVENAAETAAGAGVETAGAGRWAADDHLARIAPAVEPTAGGSRTPVYRWLVGEAGPPNCLTLVQQSWTTTGAQLFPRAPARLSPGAYRSWRARSNVVYAGGAGDPIRAGFPRTGGDTATGDAEEC